MLIKLWPRGIWQLAFRLLAGKSAQKSGRIENES